LTGYNRNIDLQSARGGQVYNSPTPGAVVNIPNETPLPVPAKRRSRYPGQQSSSFYGLRLCGKLK